MPVQRDKLVETLKFQREALGLSLRKLSEKIGVSFSTLARIERGDGEPDNNSLIRILNWLDAGGEEGLSFDNVAFVHFRAPKDTSSKTVKNLLQVANHLKIQFKKTSKVDHIGNESAEAAPANNSMRSLESLDRDDDGYDVEKPFMALSKSDMEEMADRFRKDLGIDQNDRLEALRVQISGVQVKCPADLVYVEQEVIEYLTGAAKREWSAMSVPLDYENDQWVIFRNNLHSEQRQAVTYLEECWHILLGHKLTKITKVPGGYGRSYESEEEDQAYYLAAASLLPKLLVEAVANGNNTAIETAAKYGVSLQLLEYRIKRLGLWAKYKGKSPTLGLR
jgi:transcriptional regulator with XRE-family HTH domain/Zn-dependent peptidase ImmA (M78 family)